MKSIENKTSLILDLFLCMVFIPILVTLGPAHHWFYQWPLFSIISCAYLYGCYFVVMRINVPKLLISKRYHKIASIISVLVIITYLLSLYPLPDMEFVTPSLSEYQTKVRNFGVSVTLWLMFSLVMGYALTISFVKELYEQLILKKKIEAQRDKAELAVFKAQISPHFLFNTLNSLYSLVIGTSEKAENALSFLGFRDFRVRLFHDAARLQVTKEQMTLALAERENILQTLGAWFSQIDLDLNPRKAVD